MQLFFPPALVDLSNVVVGMVSILLPISNCSIPLSKPLETIPSAPTIIGITITHIFNSLFFSSQAKSTYSSIV